MEEVPATGTGETNHTPQRPGSLEDLKFKREPMVRWLEPGVLADAALRVVLSSVFGQYADKRESQAALEEPPHDYSDRAGANGEFWLDYVSDLADGFDSTYAVARLLGREALVLKKRGEEQGTTTPRGHVLVMGGDEIYPTPTREAYENRFRGPYQAALPWVPGRGKTKEELAAENYQSRENPPHLYAIPGNHDWYDGLANFPRFFCSDREIGGWQTRQKRSYFALQLPHGWWLFAVDIQLDTYIDDPQIRYFTEIATRLEPGDRIILVTGKPSWVKVRHTDDGQAALPLDEQPASYKNLAYFRREVIPDHAEVPVMISGDLHHYAHYCTEGKHLITAGGGGAYLSATHTLPPAIHLPGEDGSSVAYRCGDAAIYPSRAESKEQLRGALNLRKHAPNLIRVIASFYAILGLSLFWALEGLEGWWVAVGFVVLLLGGGLIVYAGFEKYVGRKHKPDWKRKVLYGGLHGVPHLVLAAIPAVVMQLCLELDGAGWAPLAGALAGLLGLLGAGLIFGAYLILVHRRAPKHANDVLAAQGIPDFKNFLRLRIDANGLRIYPVAVPQVPRQWDANPGGGPSDAWLEPRTPVAEPHLIEGPIDVPPRPAGPPE